MYKCKLQELCQRRSWDLPEYTTVKYGPHHMPRFTASVKVKGQVFETPAQCKAAKDAQNTAARIAFQHFSVPPPPRVNPQPNSSSASTLDGVIPSLHAVQVADPLPLPSSSSASTLDGVIPPLHAVQVADPHPLPSSSSALTLDGVIPPLHAVPVADPLPTVSSATPVPEMEPVDAVGPFNIVSPLPSSLPLPPPGLLVAKKNAHVIPSNREIPQLDREDTTQTSMVYRTPIGSLDMLHLYKSRLQQYSQKKNLGFPVYTCEAEGPPHACRFKSRVSFGGKSYETLEFFSTLKEAEQASAKVACQALSIDVIQEDGHLYKNLLQVLAQKKGLCPSYATVSSGWSHSPKFESSVEIGNNTFQGAEAKNKKQAEMNAAKVAYCALTESFPVTESRSLLSSMGCAVADNLAQNIEPTATIKKDQDSTDEESQIHTKRAKSSSPENVNVNSNSSSDDSPLISSQVKHSAVAESVTELPVVAKPSPHRKTVVFPFKSKLPIPDGASVLTYSDEQWVAYKVELNQESTA